MLTFIHSPDSPGRHAPAQLLQASSACPCSWILRQRQRAESHSHEALEAPQSRGQTPLATTHGERMMLYSAPAWQGVSWREGVQR